MYKWDHLIHLGDSSWPGLVTRYYSWDDPPSTIRCHQTLQAGTLPINGYKWSFQFENHRTKWRIWIVENRDYFVANQVGSNVSMIEIQRMMIWWSSALELLAAGIGCPADLAAKPVSLVWSATRGCWLLFVLPTFRTFWKGTPHIETLEKHPILNKLNPLQSNHVDPVSPRYYHNQTIYCNMNKFLNWLVMGQADVVQHGSVLASSSLPERSA